MIALWLAVSAPAAETHTFDEVAAELAEHTGGAIVPTGAPGPPAFVIDPRPVPSWRAVPPRPPWEDTDLFRFDVAKWLEHTGAATLVDGKRAFYAELAFLHHEQLHERPWPYLAAWQELFHPPLAELELPLSAYTPWFGPGQRPEPEDPPWFDPAFQERLDAESQTELTRGNGLTLLGSDEAFHEKLRMIREATESLYVSVMFFGCDETSDALADAMAERAAAGVDVRLITEAVYRSSLSRRCTDRLILRGIRVANADAALRPSTAQAVLHYKVWIRDGEELIQGGANILDYENLGDGTNFMDRDTDLHVTGPMVADATEAFLLAWDRWSDETDGDEARLQAVRAEMEAQRQAGDRGAAHYATWLADPEQRMDGLCRLALQDLMAERHAIAPLIEAHLEAARHQVVLVAPAMDDAAHDPETRIGRLMALIEERDGPEDPKLIVLSNGRGGGAGELGIWLRRHHWWYRSLGNRFWPPLMRQYQELVSIRAGLRNRRGAVALQERNPNAEVWLYFQHLHTKTWLFDGQVTVVGSWNLDRNSADLNHENASVCYDAGLRDAIERDFTWALTNAIPVVAADDL